MLKPKSSLEKRMSRILVFYFLVLIFIIVGTFQFSMLESIKSLEDEYVRENIEKAQNALVYPIQHLDALAFDWAIWDDTYTFIQDLNQEYLESALTEDSITNLKVNYFSFIESNGQEILTIVNRDETVTYNRSPQFEGNNIKLLLEFIPENSDAQLNGFIEINAEPHMFSIKQVTKSDGSGNNVGYLFLAQQIDREFIESINQQYLINLNLMISNAIDQNAENLKSDNVITSEISFDDVFGKPLFSLQINVDRKLYNIASRGLNLTLVIISSFVLLFAFIIHHFWSKNVLTRLLSLKNEVMLLDENTQMELIENNSSEDRDELDHLRSEIITMHKNLSVQKKIVEKKSKENEDLNKSLEDLVNQRTQELIYSNELLKVSEQNYRTIVNEFPDLIFVLNREGRFVACEGGMQNHLLITKEDFINKKTEEVLPAELYLQLNEKINNAIISNSVTEFEYSLTINGEINYYKAKIVLQQRGEIYIFISDISKSTKLFKEIETLSYEDQLTGLYNRRYFEIEYKRLNIMRNLPLSVLALDIDGLKLVNDAFGHLSGDYLLKEVSTVIKKNLRSDDISARMGGDEFLILLPRTDEDIALKIMERIKKDISSVGVNGISASISIGHWTTRENTMPLDDVLKFADERMYIQKSKDGEKFKQNAILGMYERLIALSDCEKLHSEYVLEMAIKIGKKLNLSKSDLENLEISAKYHDIGKLGIPWDILSQDSVLSSEEYLKVKKHCEIGYQVVKSSEKFRDIADDILHHHEHWDGTGYPHGLEGRNIPLLSRIIHVVDAFEAMIHYRSYRSQMKIEEAVEELKTNAGKQFDPDVVKAFLELLEE